MSSDIKVGDVCEVIGACCPHTKQQYIGIQCVIVAGYGGPVRCRTCGLFQSDCVLITSDAIPSPPRHGRAVPRKFLRKIDPPADGDATPRTDFKPADPEGWDITTWHPGKTRVKEEA
jgi:hypothetical protein